MVWVPTRDLAAWWVPTRDLAVWCVPTRDLAVWCGFLPDIWLYGAGSTFPGDLSRKPFQETFPGNLSWTPVRHTLPQGPRLQLSVFLPNEIMVNFVFVAQILVSVCHLLVQLHISVHDLNHCGHGLRLLVIKLHGCKFPFFCPSR